MMIRLHWPPAFNDQITVEEPTERNNEAKRFERTTITTGTNGHVIEGPIEAAILEANQKWCSAIYTRMNNKEWTKTFNQCCPNKAKQQRAG